MPAPGEALLIKLWDTIADKGIGSLLRPWQMRREGRANVDVLRTEILVFAQAERDAEAIRKGEKLLSAGNKAIDARPLPALPSSQGNSPVALPRIEDVAWRNATADALKREVHLAKAVLHAEQELEMDNEAPNDARVADDWLYRWRECAASVSSEELQSVWGKVLAGEIKTPGRFSLRTLEFLRNLSQAEAKAIERLSPFVLGNQIVFRGNNAVLEAAGILFRTLLDLQELGILSGVDAIGLQTTTKSNVENSFMQTLTSHGKVLLVKAPEPAKQFTLNVCTVTAVGQQVLQLGTFEPNEPYLHAVADAIKTQGFTVELASYVKIAENQIRVFDAQQL